MASNISLPFASYNMHGFRNGAGMLNELCRTHKVISVQEHWLREDELNKFSLVHNDFNFHGASGMMGAAASGLIRERPFGGTGFLWHKSFNNSMKFISCDCDNRCIVIKCNINNFVLLLFNIYFPCCDNSLEYKDEIN